MSPFFDCALRNILRVVDGLPGGYLVGMVTMFISRQGKRVGDYAAGTIVVKERQTDLSQFRRFESAADRLTPDLLRAAETIRLSEHQYEALTTCLSRLEGLPPDAAEGIAWELLCRRPSYWRNHSPFSRRSW